MLWHAFYSSKWWAQLGIHIVHYPSSSILVHLLRGISSWERAMQLCAITLYDSGLTSIRLQLTCTIKNQADHVIKSKSISSAQIYYLSTTQKLCSILREKFTNGAVTFLWSVNALLWTITPLLLRLRRCFRRTLWQYIMHQANLSTSEMWIVILRLTIKYFIVGILMVTERAQKNF